MRTFIAGVMVGMLISGVVAWAQWEDREELSGGPLLLYPLTPPRAAMPRDYMLPPIEPYTYGDFHVPPFTPPGPC